MKRILGLLLLAGSMGCGTAENPANQVDPGLTAEDLGTSDGGAPADADVESVAGDPSSPMAQPGDPSQPLDLAVPEGTGVGNLEELTVPDIGAEPVEAGPSLTERLDGTLERAAELQRNSLNGDSPLHAVLRAFTKAAGLAPASTADPEDAPSEETPVRDPEDTDQPEPAEAPKADSDG